MYPWQSVPDPGDHAETQKPMGRRSNAVIYLSDVSEAKLYGGLLRRHNVNPIICEYLVDAIQLIEQVQPKLVITDCEAIETDSVNLESAPTVVRAYGGPLRRIGVLREIVAFTQDPNAKHLPMNSLQIACDALSAMFDKQLSEPYG